MLRSLWGMNHPGSAALPKPAGICLLFLFVLFLAIAIAIGERWMGNLRFVIPDHLKPEICDPQQPADRRVC
jgi:hypothetical protein